MPLRKIHDAADAHACLNAAHHAGLSPTHWARNHGIDGRSLRAWQLNLARRRTPAEGPPALRLVELVPTPPPAPAPARYRIHCGPLCIEIDPHFDDDSLRRLLSVVTAC